MPPFPINHRHSFLSLLGFIYGSAFLSYYIQFPGLVSSSGIEPSSRLLSYAFPTINQFLEAEMDGKDAFMLSVDALCEICAMLGVTLSCIAAWYVKIYNLVIFNNDYFHRCRHLFVVKVVHIITAWSLLPSHLYTVS